VLFTRIASFILSLPAGGDLSVDYEKGGFLFDVGM
jgi:hypothetical protein